MKNALLVAMFAFTIVLSLSLLATFFVLLNQHKSEAAFWTAVSTFISVGFVLYVWEECLKQIK